MAHSLGAKYRLQEEEENEMTYNMKNKATKIAIESNLELIRTYAQVRVAREQIGRDSNLERLSWNLEQIMNEKGIFTELPSVKIDW